MARAKAKQRKSQKAQILFKVNGEAVEVAFAPHKTLLEVLREDLGLTGTKHGCELGECGCCAVLVDGQPVLSCLVLGLTVEGREVTTVEGMAEGARLDPLQEAFAELGAAQCGHAAAGECLWMAVEGMAVKLLAVTERPPKASLTGSSGNQIRKWMPGTNAPA